MKFDTWKGSEVVNIHRYHEISEINHLILNPLSTEHMLLIGDICGLGAGQRHLDLASGKGEMLCQYALRYGTTGIGVDINAPCITTSSARARELGVDSSVEFVRADAGTYAAETGAFDVVSCIGATWVGGGLPGTLRLMQPPLRRDGWILVGEIFWTEVPPPNVEAALDYGYAVGDLGSVLTRFDDGGLDLVEMVIANSDAWDRYSASQWLNVSNWLRDNPGDPDAADMRTARDKSRREYLEYERRYLGWGVFIARVL